MLLCFKNNLKIKFYKNPISEKIVLLIVKYNTEITEINCLWKVSQLGVRETKEVKKFN